MSRALKHHHRERLKRNRSHYWGRDLTNSPISLGRAVSAPKDCGCWMCSNKRKTQGLIFQEARELARVRDEMDMYR